MRKSELLAIKAREYERGLADAQISISERDIQGWADEAWDRIETREGGIAGKIEDTMKEMLMEIGVSICPKTSNGLDKEEE